VLYPKKILIYHLASLGDILVALPALRLIREKYKLSQITMLTPRHIKPGAVDIEKVIGEMNIIDNYIYLNLNYKRSKRWYEAFKEIKRGNFSTLFYLNQGRELKTIVRDRVFFSLCGINKIIGANFSEKLRKPILNDLGESESMRSFLVRKINKGRSIDINSFDAYGINQNKIKKYPWIDSTLSSNKIISFSIGTKWQVNDWGVDRWTELFERVSKSYPDYLIVAIGGEVDRDKTNLILENMNTSCINFCGNLTISQSSYALSKSQVFICHDSGPMHLAAAVGVKIIAIFSSKSPPGHWFPAGPSNKVFYTRIECEGCEKLECISLKKKCILSISVSDVFNEIEASIENDKAYIEC
jgi:ADP-heptose:LPS heptosyltransferase